MENNRISHAVWTLLTWIFTGIAWFVDHMAAIAGLAAVIASFFSIRASRATERLRHQQLEERLKSPPPPPVTPLDSEESDS